MQRARRRPPLLLIPVIFLVLLLAAACSSGGSEPAGPTATPVAPTNGALTVKASEWKLEPATIELNAGDEVTLTFQNDGQIVHDFTISERAVNVVSQDSSGGFKADDDQLLVGANSGDTGTITFVPTEPGTYEFYCSIANHRQLGMQGVLIVK